MKAIDHTWYEDLKNDVSKCLKSKYTSTNTAFLLICIRFLEPTRSAFLCIVYQMT